MILFMKRKYTEPLFWVFIVYQFGWTVLRNSGELERVMGMAKALLLELFKIFQTEEQGTVESK